MPDGEPPQRRKAAPTRRVDVRRERVWSPVGVAVATAVVHDVLRAERVRSAHVTVTLVGARRMRSLHRLLTGVAGGTDIVTLEYDRGAAGAPVVGEVFISPEAARRHARAYAIPWREEMIRLLVHGTLHVLGYTHPDTGRESSPMWRRQERLVRRALRPKHETA